MPVPRRIWGCGVTIVIIREDLIKEVEDIPTMLQYKIHADKDPSTIHRHATAFICADWSLNG